MSVESDSVWVSVVVMIGLLVFEWRRSGRGAAGEGEEDIVETRCVHGQSGRLEAGCVEGLQNRA